MEEIRELVLQIRYARQKESFASYFMKNPGQVDPLVNLIFGLEPYPLKEYASWILVHLAKSGKIPLEKYYPELVDVIFKTNDQSVLRNVVNCIFLLEHSACRESELIDLLISFIQNPKNKVALQVYSIYTLLRFVQLYPELKEEIRQIIEINAEGKSVAYQIAVRKFLSQTK